MSTVLGGPYNGYSGKQTITSKRDNEGVMTRRILRSSWNTPQAATQTEITSPFKSINNLGNNRKFVSDSSDYIRFRKQRAINRNYNDSAN
ncbi:MAG: hypothetical protein ACO3UU_10980 [Minisyncoccia bacterium]